MDALTYKSFSFAYPNAGGPVIEGADLCLEEGAFAILSGATGSGKTTLLECAKPEIRPKGKASGDILMFGESLMSQDSCAQMGFVFQDPENQIVCDTVWRELAFGLECASVEPVAMRRRIAEITAFFGIEEWLDFRTSELSNGQKQKLNLASALAMQPKVLLLDEPTSQLDPVAERVFLGELFRVNRELGITVLVATHSPERMTDYATCAYAMENGSVKKVSVDSFRFDNMDAGFPCRGLPLNVESGNKDIPVRASDVFFRYERERRWVLRSLSIEAHAGEALAIVGGNGSGKTTLLKVLGSLLKPERGHMRNALSASQAYLPQNPKAMFVCDTVADEVRDWMESAGYSADDVAEISERLGLVDLMGQHPYDLSGGQQQLLALAKVALLKPKLLLLDEPAKGLDAASLVKVGEVVREFVDNGALVIFVTHDLTFASRVADEVAMVFDGGIVAKQRSCEFFDENIYYRPDPNRFSMLWDSRNRT